jgi:hypothetical protein
MKKMVQYQKRKPSQLLNVRPTRQEILEKLWYVFLGLMLMAVMSYSIYTQIIHHP